MERIIKSQYSRRIRVKFNLTWTDSLYCPDCPCTVLTVLVLSWLPLYCPDCPCTFLTVLVLSDCPCTVRLSLYCPDCPCTVLTVLVLSWLSLYCIGLPPILCRITRATFFCTRPSWEINYVTEFYLKKVCLCPLSLVPTKLLIK